MDILCILGDLNGWIGDRTRDGITGAFGIPGENDNGRKVVEFCAERGLNICGSRRNGQWLKVQKRCMAQLELGKRTESCSYEKGKRCWQLAMKR